MPFKMPPLVLLACTALLAGCAANPDGKSVRIESDHLSLKQLAKTDLDRAADVEFRENTQSLRLLMAKLYKRNPQELRKSSAVGADEMAAAVFENRQDWRFSEINEAQGADAVQQAFLPEFTGDRVLSFIVGLQTMLIKSHGGKTEFYLSDRLDPQSIYNNARNVEIAVWKLSTARDENGRLFLLTNEINDTDRNLSFEREFGKIIGRLDMYAVTLSEKLQRGMVRVVQTMATALFLPL